MEEYSSIPLKTTGKILRSSIFAFLQNYQYFTITAAFLAFPFAASALLSQSFVLSSSLHRLIHGRLRSLFEAAGFPLSSEFVTILNLKLSQTIATSFVVLPFTLSFLLFAKASIIQRLSSKRPAPHPGFLQIFSVYRPLLITQLCNFLLILSANATCFSILLFAFNISDGLGLSNQNFILVLSAVTAVFYSIVLANALIISNLALVVSGMENCGGYLAILKACVIINGRASTALSLALPVNMALASVEALFHYRVVRAYHHAQTPFTSMALEGMFLAYLYAILLAIDTIVGCIFLKSCRTDAQMHQEGRFSYQIEVQEKHDHASASLKILDEIP